MVGWMLMALAQAGPRTVEEIQQEVAEAYGQGDYDAVHALLLEEKGVHELAGDQQALAQALTNLGVMDYQLTVYAESEAHFAEAQTLYEALDDQAGLAETLNNRAALAQERGDWDLAERMFGESIALHRSLDVPFPLALGDALHNLSKLLRERGRLDEAGALSEQAVALAAERLEPDHPRQLSYLMGLAVTREAQGELAEARRLFEQAESRAADIYQGPHPFRASALNNLAFIHHRMGDTQGAMRLTRQSLDMWSLFAEPDDPRLATVLSNQGVVLHESGQLEEARAVLLRAQALIERTGAAPDDPDLAVVRSLLTRLLVDAGELEAAERLLDEVLAARRSRLGEGHPTTLLTLIELADLRRVQGRPEEALELARTCLLGTEAALGPAHPDLITPLTLTSSLSLTVGDAEQALALAERALALEKPRLRLVELVSEREALALVHDSQTVLRTWLLAAEHQLPAEALYEQVLAVQGSASRQLLLRARAAREAPEQARLREVRASLAWQALGRDEPDETALTALSQEKERLERQLAVSASAWSAPPTVAEVQARLGRDEAVLDFVRLADLTGTPIYRAFVVRRHAVTLVDLGPAAPLDLAVERWRALLADPRTAPARGTPHGARVTELVWTPLAAHLDGARTLRIRPTGTLARLPFGALPVGRGRLLENRRVTVLADLDGWLAPDEAAPGDGALVVGDVAYGRSGEPLPCVPGPFTDLPATAAEVAHVASAVQGPVRRLEGAAATVSAVSEALSGVSVAHLATHGFFSAGCSSALGEAHQDGVGANPMVLSGLALAAANGGPAGLLTAEQVAGLDLRGTRLVVLSACETGLGAQAAGEGVLGLQRAFGQAGARNLVVSLWTVPDQATSRLMEVFYRELRRHEPAEALRRAQLELLRDNRRRRYEDAPADWAAWVVTGAN